MSDTGLRVLCLLLCSSLIFTGGAACRPKGVSAAELEQLAKQFTGHVAGGRAGEAVKMMNATMAGAMPADKLNDLWATLVAQLGDYNSVDSTRYSEEGGYRSIYAVLLFAGASIEMKVVFDSSAKVAGLWFDQPVPTGTYTPPTYAKLGAFTETEMTIQCGDLRLPGTLTVPVGDGPFPAVVLVHGSGPNDRNETIGPNRPFQDLAWGLASSGVAVLRYEKRTKEYQGRIEDPAALTVNEETVTDAIHAIRLLQGTAKIISNSVYVLGHSLGGMMAPRVAMQAAAAGGRPVAGLIMVAAPARDLLTLSIEQSEYLAQLDGTVTATEEAQLQELRDAAARIRRGDLTDRELVLGAGRAYWADILAYDQVAAAKGLGVPMLLLQGERDYQVTMVDLALWQDALAGRANATLRSYPGLNHLMIAGEGASRPAEYNQPGNVAREVVDDIAAWILGR